jgi:hypothetical protein
MVPARSGSPEARVWIHELAPFLSERPSRLIEYARKRGFLHRVRRMPHTKHVFYVSEYGAMRLIAYIRAWQAEQWPKGRPILEHRVREAAQKRAERAKRKARARLGIANPGAGTEDEGTEDRSAGDPVKPEAVVGNPGGVRLSR